MTRLLRPFGFATLCLALILGSLSMAVARGNATALSNGGITLVLCSGFGYRTVSLDAGGNPIGPLHPCPDCLAGLSAYIQPAASLIAPQTLVVTLIVVLAPPPVPVQDAAQSPRARGPPLEV